MAVIEKLLNWIEKPIFLLMLAALIAAAAMMVHVGLDVGFRTLLNDPMTGTNEIVAGWYMVAIAFLPWAWVAQNDNHIVAGVFPQIIGPRFDYWLQVAIKLWTIGFLYVFIWQTWVRAERQTSAGEVWQVAGGFIPIWPSRWILPIAGGMMMLYLILRVVRDVLRGAPR